VSQHNAATLTEPYATGPDVRLGAGHR
jgi:hypothetical protein